MQAKVAVKLGPKGKGSRSRGLSSSTRGQCAPRSNCRYLRSLCTSEAETSKPRIFAFTRRPYFPPLWARIVPAGEGKPIVSDAHGGAGVGSWRKRMPPCNGADRGSEFALARKRADFQEVSLCKRVWRTGLTGKQQQVTMATPYVSASPLCMTDWRLQVRIAKAVHGVSQMYWRWSRQRHNGATRVVMRYFRTCEGSVVFSGAGSVESKLGNRVVRSAFEMLEPCALKVSCTVLRGARGRQRPRVYLTAPEERRGRDRMMTTIRTRRPAGSVPKRRRCFMLKPRVSEAPPWEEMQPHPQP